MNRAILAKWIWRFGTEDGALWRQILVEKYGMSHNGWKPDWSKWPQFSGFWKSICKIQSETWHNIHFKIGNGRKTFFWKDQWCSEAPLRDSFPRLYRSVVNQDALFSDYAQETQGNIAWFPEFRRELREFELVDLICLKTMIERVEVGSSRVGLSAGS